MGSGNESIKPEKLFSKQRTKSWDKKARAIVYDPFSHGLSTKELSAIDGDFPSIINDEF